MIGVGLGVCTFWIVIFAGFARVLRGKARLAAIAAALSMVNVALCLIILTAPGAS